MNDYGFIYMTYNLINGKRYIGKRKYDAAGKWVNYLGSGILLSRAIQKYGREKLQKRNNRYCNLQQRIIGEREILD